MSVSKLRIRDKEFELPKVLLSFEIVNRGNSFLQFDLFADSDDLKTAGFAINCMSIEGLSSVQDIEGYVFELGNGIENEYNELGESVICEPGQVLELDYLFLKFGNLTDGIIPIEFKAKCRSYEEDNISIDGELFAKVK